MGSKISQPEDATPPAADILAEWLAEFEAAARRPLPVRFRYAFIHTYKPVLDDESFRAFDTTADYRRWCEENLPDWLGYGCVLNTGKPRLWALFAASPEGGILLAQVVRPGKKAVSRFLQPRQGRSHVAPDGAEEIPFPMLSQV